MEQGSNGCRLKTWRSIEIARHILAISCLSNYLQRVCFWKGYFTSEYDYEAQEYWKIEWYLLGKYTTGSSYKVHGIPFSNNALQIHVWKIGKRYT